MILGNTPKPTKEKLIKQHTQEEHIKTKLSHSNRVEPKIGSKLK